MYVEVKFTAYLKFGRILDLEEMNETAWFFAFVFPNHAYFIQKAPVLSREEGQRA